MQTHLLYALDADTNKAVWATNKAYKNEWVTSLIASSEPEAFTNIYPTRNGKTWQSPAPLKAINSSNIISIKDSLSRIDKGFKTYNIQFSSLVNSMEFFLEEGSNISEIKINDFEINAVPTTKEGPIYFNFFAPPIEGFKLSLKTKNEQQKIRIVNRIIGLPTDLYSSPMPENMIHGPGSRSNVVLVKKSYEF